MNFWKIAGSRVRLLVPRFLFQVCLVLSVLLCLGQLTLRAQSTSVLDTAPGAGSPTNSGSVVPADSETSSTTVAPGTPLVSNGDFELATKDPTWPDDWEKTEGDAVTWQVDGAKHLVSLIAAQPDQHLQIYRVIDIPPGVTGLEFAARYRVADLKAGKFPEDNARVILEFLDAGKKPIEAPPPVIFAADATAWTKISERFPVPAGAVYLGIMPCLYRVDAGSLELSEIQVTTLDQAASAAAAAQAAAAESTKLADQTAIINQDLTMPPKSGEIKASGNRLVTADGKDVWLQGVNIGNLSIRPDEEHKILWSTHVALVDWHANVIRLPVLDSFWFGKGRGTMTSNDAEAYRAIADKVIRIAAGKGDYVVFDLHRYLTPDQSCVDFWKDAAARYQNNPAVLFDILNEPHDTTWNVWRNGGTVQVGGKNPHTIESVGMQALVDAVRGTGAQNLIVAGGLSYAFDLSGVVNGYALDDKDGNGIMYATHFYNWHGGWAKHILPTADKYPVLVGECGADLTKMNFIPANKQEDPYTWVPDALGFIQKNHLNWTAWCFHTRATPDLLMDWDYDTPTPFWGAFVKDALGGKQFEMKRER